MCQAKTIRAENESSWLDIHPMLRVELNINGGFIPIN
jgi:hypothetical protein